MDRNNLVRGILIGGSLGVFSVLAGLSESLFFSVGFGMLAGCAAGLTKDFFQRKK